MPDPILVVEDYDIDFESAARCFRLAGLPSPVVRASDAKAAIAWLGEQRPALVLLDLKLPGASGAEVIGRVRSSPRLRDVPVVVWSGNEQAEIISEAYRLGANCFIPKRLRPEDQRRDIENLARFWFQTAYLPGAPE